MYIKEIIINGFKSFADKSNIILTPTFTGIVGPNGSGKSNIIDAIKWVLGEQSIKNLRGSLGMSDVIFSGSKSRNASNYASVTIIFDNSDGSLPIDYSEVSIKRTVYKNGENEYYLNNEKCRLKDITDLLIDSFSSKESFNIIPQGKIDEILSEKAEDRRVIFEEAAGVLKYKKRRDESFKKLSNTHENIERIDMIIHELESQLIPLETEQKKAREYKEAKNKLENIEIALIAKDITDNNLLLQKLNNEKEKLSNSIESMNTETSKNNTLLEKYKLELIKLDDSISESKNKLISINDTLGELSSKQVLLKERRKYDNKDSNIQKNLINLKDEELKTKNILNGLEIDINNLNKELEELNDKLKNNTEELNEISKRRNILSSDYNTNKKREIEITAKIDLLENTILNMNKIPYSVKSILNNPNLKGIDNIIGNIIETEEKYSTMLDVALGYSFYFVITENEDAASSAIEYLKKYNKGRVTFYPLNVIKPKSIEPNILSIVKSCEGFIDIASNLVTFDKKYYNIVMSQLGNIIVALDLDSGINISRKINHRYKVITLDGEVLNVGGSITGGTSKEVTSSIGDKFELIRLKTLLKNVEEEIKTLETNINDIDYNINVLKDNIYKNNVELLKVKETLQVKNSSYEDISKKYNNILSEIKTLSSKSKESIDKELKNIMEEYYKNENKKQEINKLLEVSLNKKKDLVNSITELENLIKKFNSDNNSSVNKLNENEISIVKINMTIDNLLNRLNEEYNLTYENAHKNYELDLEESIARNIVNDLKKQIKTIGEVNLGSIEEYDRINKRYTFLNNQKEDLINSEKDLIEIINSMNEVMKEKFYETFKVINREFNIVFKKLFGGGEASLKLTDPSNILETGIEIVAIPSGKTLKPISLLSGGEKTLTAISLLFAIMNLKHVPFAILDEVESALDDVNAEKFGEYLQNYKGKTQLLLITHKKKTMEYVDLLYGITMQESGVSKLVSVKLEEIK